MPESPRLLIVDDDEVIRRALSEFLTRKGYRVDTAAGRREAMGMLRGKSYALVIADLQMQGTLACEGFALVSFVREVSPATRVIVLSGRSASEVEAEVRLRGADVFLQKPMPLAAIEQVVRALLTTTAVSGVV